MRAATLNASERALLARADLQPAAEWFAAACAASRAHDITARAALREHGDHGPQISGIVREHFPEHVRNGLRELARMASSYSEHAHTGKRPPRVRPATMRALARAVATRDGSGFYGPQGRLS